MIWLIGVLLALCSPSTASSASPLVFDWKEVKDTYDGRLDQLNAFTVDAGGNAYLVGAAASATRGLNLITLKLSPSGQVLWQTEYDGSAGGDDVPGGVTVNADGDVFVTGSSMNSAGDADVVTLRYTADGSPSPFWADEGEGAGVRRYDGDANGFDSGRKVIVDANGFTYVAASSPGVESFSDIVLLKYSLSGALFWQVRYDGPGHFSDTPRSLKFTSGGNLLVLGESTGDGTESDWVMLQYDVNGNPAAGWPDTGFGPGVRRYNHTGSSFDVPAAMEFDSSGAIYVAGTANTTGGGKDMVVAKFNAAGALVWSTSYNGEGIRDDEAVLLARDSTGDLVVAGNTDRASSGSDMVLLRLTEAGGYSTTWADMGDGVGVRRYASAGTIADVASGLALDAGGHVFFGGYSHAAGTADDAVALVYRRDGTFLGAISFDDGTGASERPIGLFRSPDDRVILAGTSFGDTGDDDFLVVSFGLKPLLDVVPDYVSLITGGVRTFTLPVANPAGYTYQWRRNSEVLSVADEHELTVNVLGTGQAGEYTVTVGNDHGTSEYVAGEITHLAVSWISGAGTEIRLTGKSGAGLLVDSVDNLVGNITWTPLHEVTLGAGTSTITDAGASGLGRRFYRVRRVAGE